MPASETFLHRRFSEIVSAYHPFAEYEGYAEQDDYFVLAYRGVGEQQYLIVDSDGETVLGDTTVGTTRWTYLISAVADLFS